MFPVDAATTTCRCPESLGVLALTLAGIRGGHRRHGLKALVLSRSRNRSRRYSTPVVFR